MSEKVLIIDNVPESIQHFKNIFGTGDNLLSFQNGDLDNVKSSISEEKPEVILIDHCILKKFNLNDVRKLYPNINTRIPVIIFTHNVNFEDALHINASDFIKLPVDKEEIFFRIKNAIYHNNILNEVEQQREQLKYTYTKNKRKTINLFGKHIDLKKAKREIDYQKKQIEVQSRKLELAFQKNKKKTIELFGKHVDLKKAKKEIDIQSQKIEKQNKEIKESIQYASIIQSSAMPRKEDLKKVLKDYFILYIPKTIVSGDFYWIGEKGNKKFVIAADCTGHGIPGAFMSMMGISLLNEIIHQNHERTASEILNILREKVILFLNDSGSIEVGHDGMDVALSIINKKTKTIQFSGANNPLYLIRNCELYEYKANRMPVGFSFRLNKSFDHIDIEYKKGDCIYQFSDGYVDQFGGDEGAKLRNKLFKDMLIGMSNLPMKMQRAELRKLHETWKGEHEQIDDILVVGIRL